MDDTAEVRSRLEADLPQCCDALRRCHEIDRYPGSWPRDPAAWLSPPSLLGAWVATVGGRVCGHVALTGDDVEHDAECPAEVRRLFVTPEAQRSGLAVALLDAATHHAAALGRRVELTVVEDSAPAIRLYERLGWTLLGREPAPFTWADGTRPVERRYTAPARSVDGGEGPDGEGPQAANGGRDGREAGSPRG